MNYVCKNTHREFFKKQENAKKLTKSAKKCNKTNKNAIKRAKTLKKQLKLKNINF